MPSITQRMLTKQLRALEQDRLVIRKVYAEVPPRVEYRLSETGESLRPVIDTLKAWGEGHQERLSCAPGPATNPAPDPLEYHVCVSQWGLRPGCFGRRLRQHGRGRQDLLTARTGTGATSHVLLAASVSL